MGTVSNCSVSGHIEANAAGQHAFAGGIVGWTSQPTPSIVDCLNKANIIATTSSSNEYSAYAGGIVGCANRSITIETCFSIGSASAKAASYVFDGGVVGSSQGVVKNCYYSSKSAKGIGENQGGATNVLALNDSQMRQQSSFVGFDFDSVWGMNPDINNGYPHLRVMHPSKGEISTNTGFNGEGAVSSVVAQTYLEILEREKAAICVDINSTRNAKQGNIAIIDVFGDSAPELLFLTWSYDDDWGMWDGIKNIWSIINLTIPLTQQAPNGRYRL